MGCHILGGDGKPDATTDTADSILLNAVLSKMVLVLHDGLSSDFVQLLLLLRMDVHC